MRKGSNYNPDVLNCLANLSSDEVFTPPAMANRILDLLPAQIWSDKNATFLDPVCKSGTISSETYLCIGPFDSKGQAESALSYLFCRLTRFLILLHKPAQGTTREVYSFVPMQDFDQSWSDEKLYKKYKLTADEIAFVESLVRPMENGNDDE